VLQASIAAHPSSGSVGIAGARGAAAEGAAGVEDGPPHAPSAAAGGTGCPPARLAESRGRSLQLYT